MNNPIEHLRTRAVVNYLLPDRQTRQSKQEHFSLFTNAVRTGLTFTSRRGEETLQSFIPISSTQVRQETEVRQKGIRGPLGVATLQFLDQKNSRSKCFDLASLGVALGASLMFQDTVLNPVEIANQYGGPLARVLGGLVLGGIVAYVASLAVTGLLSYVYAGGRVTRESLVAQDKSLAIACVEAVADGAMGYLAITNVYPFLSPDQNALAWTIGVGLAWVFLLGKDLQTIARVYNLPSDQRDERG